MIASIVIENSAIRGCSRLERKRHAVESGLSNVTGVNSADTMNPGTRHGTLKEITVLGPVPLVTSTRQNG